ncbi:hypothetical protein GGR51DRAFT_573552 [Nemania sp. FL0031]|nr:hypothetical protein GGR51DRAFT_573552 [Nemania sp. FL0031]
MRPYALFPVFLASTTALPQAGTTTCFPTMWASETSISSSSSGATATASTSQLGPRVSPAAKTLSLCCCCMSRPPYAFDEPAPTHWLGECSKAGTRDVCGSNYTGASGFSMNGLEGHPDRISAQCSVSRCGAMRFVD